VTRLEILQDLQARHAKALQLVHDCMTGLAQLAVLGTTPGHDRKEFARRAQALLRQQQTLWAIMRSDIPINEVLNTLLGPMPGPDADDATITGRVLRKQSWLADNILWPMLGNSDDQGLAIESLMVDVKLALAGSAPKTICALGQRDPRRMDFTQEIDADVAVLLAHYLAGRMGFDGETAVEKLLGEIGYPMTYSGWRHLERRQPKEARARMRRAGRLSMVGEGLSLEDQRLLTPAEQKVLGIDEILPDRTGDMSVVASSPAPGSTQDTATERLMAFLERLLDRARSTGAFTNRVNSTATKPGKAGKTSK
jgi:hypothetical protein